ncbi:MAG: tRNA (adenosine(37)-N6)-dimethylallyltransferase MiaA [Rhodospirillaceae bacterium]|nr:tRNA (adenosine(37)-N6)-dimethylallyltransferase MiaA [Rhodospirillaceae bacterium]|tara:strand:- start:22269 stop:23213 length:945 start_codon:yes stop_codon:yes gene_type:complete
MAASGKVLVVAGPTASGKTDLAVDAAEKFGGAVINADSMQIYQGLEVLTASPGLAARLRAPHKLYGIRDPATPCSAGEWVELAKSEISASLDAGLLPIVVGGTGMYLRTLMSGIARMPPVPSEIRSKVRARMKELGSEILHTELQKADPESAKRLDPSDSQRIARATEIFEATGKPLTYWHNQDSNIGQNAEFVFTSILLEPPRDVLYQACNTRFEQMLSGGALDEVKSLSARRLDPDLPAMKALGIPDLLRHIDGQISIEEACIAGQQSTRRYAKRQGTWFKNQFIADITFNAQYNDYLKDKIFSFISKNLLT